MTTTTYIKPRGLESERAIVERDGRILGRIALTPNGWYAYSAKRNAVVATSLTSADAALAAVLDQA